MRKIIATLALLTLGLTACDGYRSTEMGQGDFVTNFDNKETRRSRYTRDWPVNFIFYGPGANVNRVKSILNTTGADGSGGAMYLWLGDSATSGTWDTDSGRKDTLAVHPECDGPGFTQGYTYLHMRVYADGDDKLTNTTFGNYVVGTSHYDQRENCNNERFGWSEDAEADWANRIRCAGYTEHGGYRMNNAEPLESVGNHVRQSDGWARTFYIPSTTPSPDC